MKKLLIVIDYQKDFVDYVIGKSFFTDANTHLTYLGSFVSDVIINQIGGFRVSATA